MSDKPLTPAEKQTVELAHLAVIALMGVAETDRVKAAEAVAELSPAQAHRLLLSAVEIGGFLLRWSKKAEAVGGGISVAEVLSFAAAGLSDGLVTPGPTLH